MRLTKSDKSTARTTNVQQGLRPARKDWRVKAMPVGTGKMKKIFTAIGVLAYGGFIVATVKFATKDGRIDYTGVFSAILLITVNCLCARYLFKKAEKHKIEWALFGLIGNLTALFCFWDLQRRRRI